MNKIKSYSDYIKFILMMIVFITTGSTAYADQALISLFPLTNYDQTLSTWIKPTDPNFDKPLLSKEMQQKRLNIFYDHYFGSLSPWNAEYITKIFRLSSPNNLKSLEQNLMNNFSNERKPEQFIGYGENFRPYDKSWIKEIANNINISQFDELTYQANHRGIAIDNLKARVLPTADVHFYNHHFAGQGYPFDNLQMSALWAGTPIYIVSETRDHAWMLVITPDYIGWVKSSGIARADDAFIDTWTKSAKNKLAAITHTKTGLVDENGKFLLLAYVGSVFPGFTDSAGMKIMIPVSDADHHALIRYARVTDNDISFMPLNATPHHFYRIMSTMIGRPYGWGSLYFYNDCSAELKSLFTPFGIWLPRHSSNQISVGKMVDMTTSSPDKRLSYLMENGQQFLTIIYIGGHIVMYVGNYADPNKDNALMVMTFQNIWGLSPNPPIRRAVIGKSVLFPMLLQYPEDPTLTSLAAKKFFQVSYLNQIPSSGYLLKENRIDLKSLMYPEALFDEG